jgi:hypothetical protein
VLRFADTAINHGSGDPKRSRLIRSSSPTACRLVTSAFRNAAECGTENADTDARRSGISAATPHATVATLVVPGEVHSLHAAGIDQRADVLNQCGCGSRGGASAGYRASSPAGWAPSSGIPVL